MYALILKYKNQEVIKYFKDYTSTIEYIINMNLARNSDFLSFEIYKAKFNDFTGILQISGEIQIYKNRNDILKQEDEEYLYYKK